MRFGLPHAILLAVATVNIHDDEVRRFVVRYCAYDPDRRERRHQVVAVVDKQREFERLIGVLSAELESRREAGEDVDPREHYSAVVLEPDYWRKQRNARLLRRAMKHGVRPPAGFRNLDLPASFAFMEAEQG